MLQSNIPLIVVDMPSRCSSYILDEKLFCDAILQVLDVVQGVQDVKGFFKVVPGRIPALSICKPDEGNSRDALDLGGKGFVTSCGLIQLGAAADVEIRLDGIELIRGFDYEIEALFSLAIVGDLGHVYPKLRLDLRNAHLLEVGDIS